MKKNLLSILLVALFLVVLTGTASAAYITAQSPITTANQTFNYNFTGLAPSDGVETGTFTLFGRGDFTINAGSGAGETASWNLDGIASSFAHPYSGLPTGISTIEHSLQDVSFSAVWAITATDLLSMTSDGLLGVTLQTSSGVNIINSSSHLGFSLEYGQPVPEPTTMLLFGVGLLGLAGVNRRKK